MTSSDSNSDFAPAIHAASSTIEEFLGDNVPFLFESDSQNLVIRIRQYNVLTKMVELLDDWNVDIPSWKYPRNLESPRVSSTGFAQRFQNDGNVSRCYSSGRPRVTTPNEDRYIWQLLPKETDESQHQTSLVSSLQLPVRHFQGRPCTDA
ncbi:uncharacterized protein TNCV_2580481 [Trichonephila clavipes]|uniref:Uncharacterized protein n=1 Tax=Trichonephila clavipes TaxID=2585209 RepID=A0A8X6SGJ0_TRICX|nr:uncharacterized protein TNCV_2580481 [Trichonephila clavipes]